MERRLSAILVADIFGYSCMMGADEARTVGCHCSEAQTSCQPAVLRFQISSTVS